MLTATAPRMSPPRARSAAPLPAPPKSTPRLFVKRRARRSEAELIDQAARAPALSLDRNADQNESGAALAAASRERATGRTNTDPTLALFDRRADLAGLPFRRGAACRLPPDDAEHLAVCSAALRGHAHDAGILRKKLTRDGPWRRTWRHADAVPALSQALMAEGAEVREVLVEQLASIEGKAATEALAQRALYDLSPRVREEAINALADRPPAEYRPVLLGGFAHPWPPVADHAAEALVALREAGAVPALKALLSRPDPRAPYRRPGRPEVYVKELVRVNHLINCLLCHPPSFSPDDKARGRVPPLDEPLDLSPSGPGPYGLGPGGGGILAMLQKAGTVIRADITYLKQDFSLTLPVARPGIWPREQRFDFLVRERLATARDAQRALARGRAGPSEQHRAALFALHELTTPARR